MQQAVTDTTKAIADYAFDHNAPQLLYSIQQAQFVYHTSYRNTEGMMDDKFKEIIDTIQNGRLSPRKDAEAVFSCEAMMMDGQISGLMETLTRKYCPEVKPEGGHPGVARAPEKIAPSSAGEELDINEQIVEAERELQSARVSVAHYNDDLLRSARVAERANAHEAKIHVKLENLKRKRDEA